MDCAFRCPRLLGLLATGEFREQILATYLHLEAEDADETLAYAASFAYRPAPIG